MNHKVNPTENHQGPLAFERPLNPSLAPAVPGVLHETDVATNAAFALLPLMLERDRALAAQSRHTQHAFQPGVAAAAHMVDYNPEPVPQSTAEQPRQTVAERVANSRPFDITADPSNLNLHGNEPYVEPPYLDKQADVTAVAAPVEVDSDQADDSRAREQQALRDIEAIYAAAGSN